jgi:hypothetical protein
MIILIASVTVNSGGSNGQLEVGSRKRRKDFTNAHTHTDSRCSVTYHSAQRVSC